MEPFDAELDRGGTRRSQQVRPRAASRAVVPVAASAEETSRRALLGGIFAGASGLQQRTRNGGGC